MRTLLLRNSSGISAAAILDTTRKQFSPGRPPVNWVVGRADPFGDLTNMVTLPLTGPRLCEKSGCWALIARILQVR
jgi:hypothetical protein